MMYFALFLNSALLLLLAPPFALGCDDCDICANAFAGAVDFEVECRFCVRYLEFPSKASFFPRQLDSTGIYILFSSGRIPLRSCRYNLR